MKDKKINCQLIAIIIGGALIVIAITIWGFRPDELALVTTILGAGISVIVGAMLNIITIRATKPEEEQTKIFLENIISKKMKEACFIKGSRPTGDIQNCIKTASKRILIMETNTDYIVECKIIDAIIEALQRNKNNEDFDFRFLTHHPKSLFFATRGRAGTGGGRSSTNYHDEFVDSFNKIMDHLTTSGIEDRKYRIIGTTTRQLSYISYIIDDKMFVSFIFAQGRSRDHIHIEFLNPDDDCAEKFIANFDDIWNYETDEFQDKIKGDGEKINYNCLVARGSERDEYIYKRMKKSEQTAPEKTRQKRSRNRKINI
jgi:hypothetical protein